MWLLKFAAAFTLVEVAAIIGWSQIFLAFRVTFPLTKALETQYGGVDGFSIRDRAASTVVIWIVIFAVIGIALAIWGDKMALAGAGTAFLLAFLITFGRCRPNPGTALDYLQTYGRFISEETQEQLRKSLLESML